MTCAEVNEIFLNMCRSSCAKVHPCRISVTQYWLLYDDDSLKMLVAESLFDIFRVKNRTLTPQISHQHHTIVINSRCLEHRCSR